MNKLFLSAALAGAMTASFTTTALAVDREKCYGAAETGKNDCMSADGKVTCAGQSTRDRDANDWKFVAKGECEKQGGTLEAPKAAK